MAGLPLYSTYIQGISPYLCTNGLSLIEQALINHSNALALEDERTKRIPCLYKDFIYLNLSLIELHAVPGSDVIGI